jgi:AcrR family transcriptional regulator
VPRLSSAERREQILQIASEEFANGGLHGTSTDVIARRAGITQAYVFRLFGTKKKLFLEVVSSAFERMTEGVRSAAGDVHGVDALALMGRQYDAALADRTLLLLQLQGFAACGDPEVRDAVQDSFGQLWQAVADAAQLDPVTVKTFLAYGMLLNTSAALEARQSNAPWARGVRTRIHAGLFQHVTTETNR